MKIAQVIKAIEVWSFFVLSLFKKNRVSFRWDKRIMKIFVENMYNNCSKFVISVI